MKKNKLHFLIGFLIGIILVFVWLYFVNPVEMLSYLKKLQIHFVIISVILYLLSYFIRSLRWKILLSPEIKISPIKTYLIWMSGNFLNYIIPIRAGEIAKSYFLKRTDKIRISKTLPSVFIDKMFDSVAIFVVILLIPFLDVNISKPLLILIIILVCIVILGGIVLVSAALAKDKIVKILHKFFFFIPKKYEKKFLNLVELFIEGVGLFKHHLNLLPPVIGLTLLAVIIDSIYFSCIFLAFQQPINYFLILFGYTLIYLSYILPQPPAQIGSNELIMVIIFSVGLSLNKEMVSAVMSFAHLLTGLLVVGIGIFSFSFIGIKVADTFNISKLEGKEKYNKIP